MPQFSRQWRLETLFEQVRVLLFGRESSLAVVRLVSQNTTIIHEHRVHTNVTRVECIRGCIKC